MNSTRASILLHLDATGDGVGDFSIELVDVTSFLALADLML